MHKRFGWAIENPATWSEWTGSMLNVTEMNLIDPKLE